MYNILDLLKNKGISPVKAATTNGGEYHSPCPGCGGEDRFLSWPAQNEGKGGYYCRQCRKCGDNIQFLRDFSGMSFKEAKNSLGLQDVDWTPPALPAVKPKWQPQDKNYPAEIVDLEAWLDHATKFVETCHQALLASEKGMAWLAGRGISLDSVKKYQLGIHATPEYRPSFRPRESWGLSGGKHPKTGQPLKFILPAGVVIPWFVDGQLHRIRIRLTIADQQNPKKKYHAVVGSAMDTFITDFKAKAYVAVETELDAIMLDGQAGDLTGAIALGSSAAKPTAAAAASMQEADVVLNALDFDQAGGKASRWWSDNFTNARRHPVPNGGDPGEAYEVGVDIRQWVWCGLPASLKIGSMGEILSSPPPRPAAETSQQLPVEDKSQQHSPPADVGHIPHDVITLADLLSRCPVYIENSRETLAVGNMRGFDSKRHWALRGKISQLLFSDPVMQYLDAHSSKIITASNLVTRG